MTTTPSLPLFVARGQQLAHQLRRSSDRRTSSEYHDGPLQQPRVVRDRTQNRIVVRLFQSQAAELVFVASCHGICLASKHPLQRRQLVKAERILQILHHLDGKLTACREFLYKGQGFARFGTAGVVINRDHCRPVKTESRALYCGHRFHSWQRRGEYGANEPASRQRGHSVIPLPPASRHSTYTNYG